MNNDVPEIPTESIAETENYTIWVAQEPDEEVTYHLELGAVTVHFFQEEWEDFLDLVGDVSDEAPEEGEEEMDYEVELDWGSLYFSRDEWEEFKRLLGQIETE
ncbi:MAG TPA: hypothetical protein PKD09_24390 [Aggregatilinea sp.]|jgi:hypothetical protein|uniref:hypothetical protein n=1 Tax=Aggregatilinea sp. TaxID=2806333 RepID=UPI002B918746|nr:hypothetical protein [Aggregatilinea sp.]HML24816.1 hypothetical protein [Aggregatilinea sp.]